MKYIEHMQADKFIRSLEKESVHLCVIDPPYFDIVDEGWDKQWKTEEQYVRWLVGLVSSMYSKLTPTGSLLMFGAVGKHGSHPFFEIIKRLDAESGLTYRNLITWKKRRAYGKSHDYLFCREEIVWYSRSEERTGVTFNIPLLDVKRGYMGWNKDHPAKSEYKRVSNVWDDIPELMRPTRTAEKPVPLLERIVSTHSNPGDLVVDFFAGTGSTGVAAHLLGRRFRGCDIDREAAEAASMRVARAYGGSTATEIAP